MCLIGVLRALLVVVGFIMGIITVL
jgi:hypothetical protein